MSTCRTTLLALLFCLAVTAVAPVQAADDTDYAALVAAKTRAFFGGTLAQSDFSLTAPWRRNFAADNLAGRAPVAIEQLELTEVRLPDNPGGLEGLFAVKARLPAAAWVEGKEIPAGSYWFSGSIRFVHTTRGWLVADVDFALLDSAGEVVGSNYLPWRNGEP
ncbi:MAG: hypothetical protein AB7Q81_10465 [Gammaproteobacteria bacterium]